MWSGYVESGNVESGNVEGYASLHVARVSVSYGEYGVGYVCNASSVRCLDYDYGNNLRYVNLVT